MKLARCVSYTHIKNNSLTYTHNKNSFSLATKFESKNVIIKFQAFAILLLSNLWRRPKIFFMIRFDCLLVLFYFCYAKGFY